MFHHNTYELNQAYNYIQFIQKELKQKTFFLSKGHAQDINVIIYLQKSLIFTNTAIKNRLSYMHKRKEKCFLGKFKHSHRSVSLMFSAVYASCKLALTKIIIYLL